MTKHYCDRCGKDISYTLTCTLDVMDGADPAKDKKYEICMDCEEELKNWIKNETLIDKLKGGAE